MNSSDLLSKSKLSIHVRILSLSFSDKKSLQWLDIACIVIEYIQLVSQIFLLSYSFYGNDDGNIYSLKAILIPMAKIFSFGNLFEMEGSVGLLAVLFALCLAKYLLCFYVILLAKQEKQGNFLAIWIWRLIVKSQPRVIYLVVTSFWVKKIEITPGWIIWAMIAILLEFTFTLFTGAYLKLIFPRKNDFLASKHNRLEIVNVSQKFLMQILQIVLGHNFSWIYSLISLMFSILRLRIYFTTLPLYKLEALFYQAVLIALDCSFGISFFVQTIISKSSLNFGILIWIILSILMIKINIAILDKIVINIITKNNLTNSSALMMIHRIHLIEEITKQNKHKPEFLARYQHLSLLETIGSKCLFDCKNDFYINFLFSLLAKFPKNHTIKLIAGYYLVRKLDMLSTGIHHLQSLQSFSGISSRNAALILSKTQSTHYEKNSQNRLDLSNYLRHLSNMNHFKGEILKQASAQETLCRQVLSQTPDLAKIFDISQFIHKMRGKIEKKSCLITKSFPEHYLEPLALCLFYQNILNFSIENNQEETQLLERMVQKYSRAFHSDQICSENLYQQQNCCFLLSGSKETFGKILFSSTNAKQYFGQDLHEKYDYHLMMPFITSQVKEKTRIISQIKDYMNNETETFCYNHKKGFVFPANCYINFYPFLGQGLNYMAIIRPKLSSKDFLILSENGDIQGFSQSIGKTLSLSSSARVNIASLVSKSLDFTEEKTLEFHPFNSKNSYSLSYLCEIETQNIFEIPMKILTLAPLEKLPSPTESESSSLSSPEHDLEEKAEGWIDFNKLSSDNRLLTTPVSTKRLLLLPPTETTSQTQMNSPPQLQHKETLPQWNSLFDKQQRSDSSNSSRAILKRMYFLNAKTRFSPRFYRPLILIMYVIFIAIIAQQICFRTILKDYLSNLKAIKNVLRVAESRNNLLMEVHRHTRYIWSLGPGGLPPSFYGAVNLYYFTLGFGPKVAELADLNKKVVAAANYLDEKSRNILFQSDVRFYETDYSEPIQQYSNMTNFQACDRVVQTGFKYQKLVASNINQAIPYMESIMRNCLNDLLIKLTTTAQFYLGALDDQKAQNNLDIATILALTLACELLVAIIFGFAAYHQFKSEKRNMMGFVRVDKSMVQQVLEKVVQFKASIQEGARFDNLADEKIILLKRSYDSNSNLTPYRKENLHHLKTKGIVLKYQKRVLQMMLILLLIILLTILNFVNGKNNMNTLFTKALKVHTADRVQPKLAIGQTAFVDLALKNDTTLIKNMAPSKIVARTISVIADIRNNQLPSMKRDDGTYDPTIQDVLYGDACKYATESYIYCLKISRGLEKFGLVQMLVNYEKILTSVNEQYSLASVKSKDLLEDLLYEAYSTAGSSMSFFKIFTTLIADIINKDFEMYYQTHGSKFSSLNTAYLIMLFVSCIVIHLVLINRLKEAEDQYRKVLLTLPPNVILSNLFIKTYLKKSSHTLIVSVAN